MPQFDLVIFGASSFVGQILCQYLVDEYGVDGEVKWAAAGRSRSKLEVVRQRLGSAAAELPLLIADASDEAGLLALCEQTRVVISTVGPYALYGEPLVKACVSSGTDYCDLTGEVHWIRRMITRYQGQAQKSGARIVHSCGFDSIPSDMGVWHLQQQAQHLFHQPASTVRLRIKTLRGGISGGTMASMVNVIKAASKSQALRKDLANPYLICPANHHYSARQHNVTIPEFDPISKQWAGAFVMAGINTRVVHRSNALQDNAYGEHFKYDESLLLGKGIKGYARAAGLAATLGAFFAGAALPPSRYLMEHYLLPKPGEGPGPEARRKGCFDFRFIGTTDSGGVVETRVTGDRDPGYGATAKMLAEAGLSLAFDVPRQKGGGFWTTATVFDQRFIERLTEKAGLRFDIL